MGRGSPRLESSCGDVQGRRSRSPAAACASELGNGRCSGRSKGQRLGEDLGVEAELARCSSGAPAWRCGVAAAVRALLRAEQFVEAARGFEGA